MLIIGERINATREGIRKAIAERDADHLVAEARNQREAGADCIDVNAGTLIEDEPGHLSWLVRIVQEGVDTPLSIDSANPDAMARALEVHRGRALLNSISGESKRIEKVLPLIREHRPRVIALCMDDTGLPTSPVQAIDVAGKLLDTLAGAGCDPHDVYLDPLVRPISTEPSMGKLALDTTIGIKATYPEAGTICGLSNISFGLPERRLINRNYLTMMIAAGIDAVIADPLDRELMGNLFASLALIGRDEYCRGYLEAFRAGRLPGTKKPD